MPCPLQDYKFGPWPIAADEVFATSPLCFAFVNLKPVVSSVGKAAEHVLFLAG